LHEGKGLVSVSERLAKIFGTCWGLGVYKMGSWGFCASSNAELSCQLCEKLRFMRVDVRGCGGKLAKLALNINKNATSGSCR